MMKLLVFTLILGALLWNSLHDAQTSSKYKTRRAEPIIPPHNDSTGFNGAALFDLSSTTMVASSTPTPAYYMSIAAISTPLSSSSTPREALPTLAAIPSPKEKPTNAIIPLASSLPAMEQLAASSTPSIITIYGILSQANDATDIPGVNGAVTKTIATTIAITISPGQSLSTTSLSGFGLVVMMTEKYFTGSSSEPSSQFATSDPMTPNGVESINTIHTNSKPNLPSQEVVRSTPSDGTQDIEGQYSPQQLHAASIAGVITGILTVLIALAVGVFTWWRKSMTRSSRIAETGPTDIAELPVVGNMRYELSNSNYRIELPIDMDNPVELRADESVESLPEKLTQLRVDHE
jgi:hypothetical protein